MKSAKYLIRFCLVLLLMSCNGQNKNRTIYPKEKSMNAERFNIEQYNQCIETKKEIERKQNKIIFDLSQCEDTLSDGTVIINSRTIDGQKEGFSKKIIPPVPAFIEKNIDYYDTGIIEKESESYVGVLYSGYGSTKYYDEQGYLIKTVDRNIVYKDAVIKLEDLLKQLQTEPLLDNLSKDEQEHFNMIFEFGKKDEEVNLEDVFRALQINKVLHLMDEEDRKSLRIDFQNNKWVVEKELYPFGYITMLIDATTGKILDKEYNKETRP